jgi:hypothetical protein
LVREIADLSPKAATVLMTAARIDPSGVPVPKSRFQRDLICAVQAALSDQTWTGLFTNAVPTVYPWYSHGLVIQTPRQ